MGTSYISRPNVQGSSLHAVMASLATRLGRGLKPVTQVIDSEYLTPPRRHQDTDRSLKGLTSVHISHPDWTAVRPVHPTCRDSSPDVSSVVTDGWPALSGGSFNNQINITAMKRTVNHLAGLLLLAAALLAASCGKENAEVAVKSVSVSPASLSLTEGESASLSATVLPDNASDKSLSWASSDRSVASVDNSGKVTALKAGSATISATAGAMSGRASVTVKPAIVAVTGVTLDKSSLELTAGESVTLVATVAPDNASDKSLTWASDHADIASVDNSGKVTALKEGSATISATAGAMSGKATVTVKPAIVAVTGVTLDKSSLEIAINGTAQLTATVKPDNASDKSLTWASDHTDIADVSNAGIVLAKAKGTATITVTTKDGGKTATCKITVTGKTVTGIKVAPATLSLFVGSSSALTVTISPSDAENKNVTWKSSDAAIAKVSDGKVTGVAAGSATVTATTEDGGFSATCAVTVVPMSDFKGSGTKADPFQISTRADLDLMATKNADFKDNYFLLMNDIDLGGQAKEFIPIGQTSYFEGHFDGNGKTISGLYVNQPSSDRQGLFANIDGAEIKNLTVSGSVTGRGHIGGIAGDAKSSSVIYNCTSNVTVTGNVVVGGIAGYAESSSVIRSCTSNATVTGTSHVGGIVGSTATYSQIISCCNTGTVTSTSTIQTSDAGGICGWQSGSTVVACYNTGSVKGSGRVGGITAGSYSDEDIVTSCYNKGSISGPNAAGVLGTKFINTVDSGINHCYCLNAAGGGTDTAIHSGEQYVGTDVTALSKTQMTDGTMLGYLNTAAKAYNAANPSLPQAWEWKAGTDGWPVFNVGTVAK